MPRQIVILAAVTLLFAAGCGSATVEDTSPLYVAERQEPTDTADVVVRFEDNCVYAYDDFDNYRDGNDERALVAFAPGVAERVDSGQLLLIGEGGVLSDAGNKTFDFYPIIVAASWQDAIAEVVWETTAPAS